MIDEMQALAKLHSKEKLKVDIEYVNNLVSSMLNTVNKLIFVLPTLSDMVLLCKNMNSQEVKWLSYLRLMAILNWQALTNIKARSMNVRLMTGDVNENAIIREYTKQLREVLGEFCGS